MTTMAHKLTAYCCYVLLCTVNVSDAFMGVFHNKMATTTAVTTTKQPTTTTSLAVSTNLPESVFETGKFRCRALDPDMARLVDLECAMLRHHQV